MLYTLLLAVIIGYGYAFPRSNKENEKYFFFFQKDMLICFREWKSTCIQEAFTIITLYVYVARQLTKSAGRTNKCAGQGARAQETNFSL